MLLISSHESVAVPRVEISMIRKENGCVILHFDMPRDAGRKVLEAFHRFMQNPQSDENVEALKELVETYHLTQLYELSPRLTEVVLKTIEKPKTEGKALVFVHGWSGDANSFGEMPNHLRAMCECQSHIFQYPSGAWKHSPSIVLVADSLRNWVNTFATGKDLAIICHSMGGLVVRQFILSEAHNSETRSDLNVRNIVFLASPHSGSAFAEIAKGIPTFRTAQIQELAPSSPVLYQIAKNWNTWVREYVPEFCRIDSIFGSNDKVVSSVNAVGTSENVVPILGRDHDNICKPNSPTDEIVTTTARFLHATDFLPDSNWRRHIEESEQGIQPVH
jgi:pimeloyl-ACP methyl ester carboxylesterase